MKKKIVLSLLTGATTSLMALGGEFAYLYKDPRIMGMGGANVALGGYSTSIFSNPAGLASMKKEEGFVVDVISFGVTGSDKIKDFANDLSSIETGNTTDALNVIKKYDGEHFQIGTNNYSSISKNSDLFAWSVGLLVASDINLEAHSNSDPAGGILHTSSRGYGGLLFGAAKEYDTQIGRVDVGVGFKFIAQKSYEGSLLASDLTGDGDLATSLQDKFEKDSLGFGLDLGVNYYPLQNNILHPSFGLSIVNIGSMGMDEQYGKQPLTVNIGAAIRPEISYINNLVLAVDYVDMFNANTIRTYTYSGSDVISFEDDTDSDFMKRLRLGAGIGLINTSLFSAKLNLGMYQSAYTAGLDMSFTVLKLNLATYEEEVGSGNVSTLDRRYMAQLGIGW